MGLKTLPITCAGRLRQGAAVQRAAGLVVFIPGVGCP